MFREYPSTLPSQTSSLCRWQNTDPKGSRGLPKTTPQALAAPGPRSPGNPSRMVPIVQTGQPRHGKINGTEKTKGRAELVNSTSVHRSLGSLRPPLFPARFPKTCPLGRVLLASADLTLDPFLSRSRSPTTRAMSPFPWPTRCSTSPVLVSRGPCWGLGRGRECLGMTLHEGLFIKINSFYFKN